MTPDHYVKLMLGELCIKNAVLQAERDALLEQVAASRPDGPPEAEGRPA